MSNGRAHRRRLRPSVLYLGPDIPEDANAVMKNALGVRNKANVSGRCPECGATFERAEGPGVFYTMRHEEDCPVLLTVALE